ncbi:MAG: hypothetical protein HY513_05230 [Candidatus Aenigmarchaeota archaeon]|nr:hypothetical protein [Candidatus Aenigmarchaeota archaeon]
MRIEIKRNVNRRTLGTSISLKPVIIITFHTKPAAFDSDYDRSKFFRELHGWRQSVPKNDRTYTYRRRGLLDEVPHVKIADSVFMAALENMERIESFFEEWEKKVDFDIMEVMMQKNSIEKLFRGSLERTDNDTLRRNTLI